MSKFILMQKLNSMKLVESKMFFPKIILKQLGFKLKQENGYVFYIKNCKFVSANQ